MSFIVDDCIRRIRAEIMQAKRLPDSVEQRKRLAELAAMLQEYEQAEAAENAEF
jgi:cell fate (sporulation/competence/biofilm development) regulator YmcA (YheA/YmcA/DUF963 family)